MESSRISWAVLWVLATLLAAPGACHTNQEYNVGNISTGFNWYRQSDANFYQNWAAASTLFVNDSIRFEFNTSKYDVIHVGGKMELSACNISNAAYGATGAMVLTFEVAGDYYFMSGGLRGRGISDDCLTGMKFGLTVLGSELDPGGGVPTDPYSRYRALSPSLSRPSGPPSLPPQPPPSIPPTSPAISIRTELGWSRQTNGVYQTLHLLRNSVLVFEFDSPDVVHVVLEVTQADYEKCTIPSKPRATYSTPRSAVVPLPDDRVYYFIDGLTDNCLAGHMKLSVIVGDSFDIAPAQTPQTPPTSHPLQAPHPPQAPHPQQAPHPLPAPQSPHTTQATQPPQSPQTSQTPQSSQTAQTDDKGTRKTLFPIAAVVVPCVLLLIFGLALLVFLYCRQHYGSKPRGRYAERHVVTSGTVRPRTWFTKSRQNSAAAISAILEARTGGTQCTVFAYEELERATKSFSNDAEVGSGGFGTVYKGTLDDGRAVAIKMAKHANDVESFVNEVSILSGVNNRNLVKLLGCCVDTDIPLLVYEFVPNGNLQDQLHKAHKGVSAHLPWNLRFKIALQTAEALKYLHVQATPPIFHRDVKSANILLDYNYNAKVADFGFSKLVDVEATHVSTVVKGTPGYLDPEYYFNSQLTDKSDVYSFGVVLLELITSKKPIDLSKPEGRQNLAVTSIGLIKTSKFRDIIDTQVSSNLSTAQFQEVEAVAKVAVACLVKSRASRPSMSEVLEMLQRIKESQLTAEQFYGRSDTQSSTIETQYFAIPSGSTDYSVASSSQATSLTTESMTSMTDSPINVPLPT